VVHRFPEFPLFFKSDWMLQLQRRERKSR